MAIYCRLRKLVTTVKIYDLSKQRDLFYTACDQLAHLAHNLAYGAAALRTRVCGTMQNVQCMLAACMIETNAVACSVRVVVANR